MSLQVSRDVRFLEGQGTVHRGTLTFSGEIFIVGDIVTVSRLRRATKELEELRRQHPDLPEKHELFKYSVLRLREATAHPEISFSIRECVIYWEKAPRPLVGDTCVKL